MKTGMSEYRIVRGSLIDKVLEDTEKVLINNINMTLGIRLTFEQALYILDKPNYLIYKGRQTGKTLAYMIYLALSDNELDVDRSIDYCDYPKMVYYANNYFIKHFRIVRKQLKDAGFKVVSLYSNGKSVEY